MTAQTVQLSVGSNLGGLIQGNFGNYQAGADNTITVDSRDAAALIAAGAVFVAKRTFSYTTPVVAAASATAYIASTTMSNGSVVVANQPVAPRQAQLVITALASPGPSAGAVAITYLANDGTTQTDSFSAVTVGVTPLTYQTSKGAVHISSVVNSGLAGGTAALTLGSTTVISLPVDPGATSVVVTKELVDATDETVGTLSTATLASITPTTAPNATHTYSFLGTFTAPTA